MPSGTVSQGVGLISVCIVGRSSHDIEWSLLALVEGLAQVDADDAQHRDDDAADEVQRHDQAVPTGDGRAVDQRVAQYVYAIGEGQRRHGKADAHADAQGFIGVGDDGIGGQFPQLAKV